MPDPLSLALSVAEKILLQVKNVKTNHAECELLEQLVDNTLKLLRQLEGSFFDSPSTTALEMVKDALHEAQQVVNKCCNTSLFTELLYNEGYASALKQAAEKLKHALCQIPLASLGMTADIQYDVVALTTQIRNAKFEERAATAHQTIALKDAFETAFNRGGQGTEDIKNLVQEVLRHQCSSTEEMRTELAVLKEHVHVANKNKESQIEFELNQIIAVITASLGDVTDAPRAMDDLEDFLRCPISKDIMTDPVVLKDSGMIYDRSSIEDWIRKGHRHDPIMNVELVSSELVPIRTLHNACQTLLGQSGGSSSIPKDSYKDSAKFQVVLGLYEGRGYLTIGSSIIHVLQLLIVEPDQKVLGYTLYKTENIIVEENVLEIGGGEWNGITNELSFGDNQYSYNGTINFGADYLQSELKWDGKVSKANTQDEGHNFALTYSPPPIQRSIALHPTILQMEGVMETSGPKAKYESKSVLSLEADSTLSGWLWFKSLEQGRKFVGHVIDGRWNYDKTISFGVYFLDQGTPLNSDETPTNHSAMFKISGNISQDERFSHSNFTAINTKVKNEGVRRSNVPLDDIKILDYSYLRESSTPWYHLHPNPVKLFNMSRAYELRSMDYSVKANFDLSYGSFSHYLRTWGRTPLHIAAWNNSIGIVKELITSGVIVDEKDDIGQSPLHHATSNNSFDVVKELIANGANVDIKDDSGKTPLCIACEKNYTKIFEELIKHGASIDAQDDNGWNLLHHSSNNNDVIAVKKLIANGANVDFQDISGASPLYIASRKGHIDVVKELIVNKTNVNLQRNNGVSPLLIASEKGHIGVVKELIVRGANVDVQMMGGWTPLLFASHKGHIDVVKELIVHGADVNLQENGGVSPLLIASHKGHIDVVKELIVSCANVNSQKNDGVSPLLFASQNGHIDVAKELIVSGADVSLQENDGWTPLFVASKNGHIDIVKKLLVTNVDVNLQENNGVSALFIASQNGHIDVVTELIANNASTDLQDNDGQTPLHIASKRGLVSIVRVLLEKRASKEVRNNEGKTPYDIVCTVEHFAPFGEATIEELKALLEI